MKFFYPNKMRFLILLVPALFVLGSGSLASIFSSKLEVKIIGIIFLLLLIFIIYKVLKFIKTPLIIIGNDEITLRHFFIKDRLIRDFSLFEVIISNDYLAFRQEKKNDISVSKSDLSKKSWNDLLLELNMLPFKNSQ